MRDLILDNVKVTLQWRRLRMLVCFLPSSDCIHKSGEREREREREREGESQCYYPDCTETKVELYINSRRWQTCYKHEIIQELQQRGDDRIGFFRFLVFINRIKGNQGLVTTNV